jgi:hypothetical protein
MKQTDYVGESTWAYLLKVTLRYLLKAAVLGGCTYLVFWRGESGWIYLPAVFIARLYR